MLRLQTGPGFTEKFLSQTVAFVGVPGVPQAAPILAGCPLYLLCFIASSVLCSTVLWSATPSLAASSSPATTLTSSLRHLWSS